MRRALGVPIVAISLAAGCAAGSEEVATTDPISPTTTAAPTTAAMPDETCDAIAAPVEVLNRTFEAFAGTDIDEVSSQEAWDRTIAQHEANAAAFTEIGLTVPQLREAADDAAAASAAHAAAGRATEPDLALIDRARVTSRTRVDPVTVVTGEEPMMGNDSPGAQVYGYVSRVCPELIGPS